MKKEIITQNEQENWKNLIEQINLLAGKKYKTKYFKMIMSNDINMNKNRVCRFFNLKNPPKINTIYLMLDTLGYELVLKKKLN